MRRIPRTKGALSGLLILILGIWGGLIPFVGPYFNYAMHSDQTWHWFMNRFWLEVLPAIAAIVGGLILMGGITRASTSLGALIALAGGIWFIVGPVVSMLWNHGVMAGGPPIAAHNVTRMLEWIGFFYGTGALITVFSAYALGFLAALPIVDERVVGRTVAAGAGAGAGYAAGRATAPRGGADEPAAAPADRAAAPADRAAAPADRAAAPADRAAAPADTAAAPADTAAAPAGAAPADTAAAPADRSAAPAGTATAPAAGASTTTGQPAANTAPRRRTGRFFRRRRSSTRA